MPILVVCTGCQARFTVSDQYAGRTGPCPKCKKPITIPKPEQAVVIHEPEPPAAAARATGRVSTKPLPKRDIPVAVRSILLTTAGFAVTAAAAWIVGRILPPPLWLTATAAFVVALACVLVGYEMVRDRDLDPHRGRDLFVRALVCAGVYAALWGVRGLLPAESTSEMYQWLFIGPIFFAAGGLAALASLELDWGPAVAHYSFYVLVTATLRWLAGMTPV